MTNATSVAEPAHSPTIEAIEPVEFSVVYALEAISDGTTFVPAGAVGTVVFVYQEDGAYEVEFEEPYQAVLSVRRRQVRTA